MSTIQQTTPLVARTGQPPTNQRGNILATASLLTAIAGALAFAWLILNILFAANPGLTWLLFVATPALGISAIALGIAGRGDETGRAGAGIGIGSVVVAATLLFALYVTPVSSSIS